ncbi:winged helix-turn-helix domain-containing protein [Streptomyces sp. NPDC052040]|uniref:winged helix-turn-helix domain-containing protein n=1 Tax=Streptomyces sp. NPDC052040 TaxID=3365682 RepID=UPI0037D1B04F
MLELRFDIKDMAHVRHGISPIMHVIAGIASSEHHCVGGSLRRDRWWRGVRRNVPHRAAPLLDLINAHSESVPDFFCADVDTTRRQLTDELDALLALPEPLVRRDLAFYGSAPGLPRIVREMRDGGTRELRRITDAVWSFFRSCLAADWPDIQRRLQADVMHHLRVYAEAGQGAMLDGLHAHLFWQDDGTLRYAAPWPVPAHELGGRGLELQPNLFLQDGVALLLDPDRPAMIGYPVRRSPGADTPGPRAHGLPTLISAARVRALHAVGLSSCTTTELARRLGVTAPTASAHAAALRTAGVIITEREGRQVRHSLTALGHELLLSCGEP